MNITDQTDQVEHPSQLVLTPEQAAQGEDAVTMTFPCVVLLTVNKPMRQIRYNRGVHQVPRQYADHWYLKAHGVTLSQSAA